MVIKGDILKLGLIYLLNNKESVTLKKYIKKNLTRNYIRELSS